MLLTFVGMSLISCQQSTDIVLSGSAILTPIVSIDRVIKLPDGTDVSALSNEITVSDCSFRLSSINGLYSAEWASIDNYPTQELLPSGDYIAEVFYGTIENEGFENPCLMGETRVYLGDGENKQVPIICGIANSVMSVDYTSISPVLFSDFEVMIHSVGGDYLIYPISETRMAYVRPGDIDVYVALTTKDGIEANFKALTIQDAKAATLYDIVIDAYMADDGVTELEISYDETTETDNRTIRLTSEMLSSQAPALAPIGFLSNAILSVAEGEKTENNIGFNISGGNLSSLMMTVTSPELLAKGCPKQIDLVSASESEIMAIGSLGFNINGRGANITSVEVTDAISHMRSSEKTQKISLLAIGEYGKISEPLILNINIEPVEISVAEVPDVYVGTEIVDIELVSQADISVAEITAELLLRAGDDEWIPVEVVDVEQDVASLGKKILRLKLPMLKAGEVEMRILYLGREKTRTKMNVVSPEFTFDIDAFAKLAYIKIQAETPQMQSSISSLANLYVNNTLWQSVVRYPEEGIIVVGGLLEDAEYKFRASLYEQPSAPEHFTESLSFQTEKSLQLPNSNFEEVATGLVYKNLPAGGRYSQNIVDIYNQQNYVSYDLYMPKKWTTVNAKTFCEAASNHNTWYLQPSTYTIRDVADGAFAVAIESTSWDLNGEAIPDYRQTETPYVNYNKNIPTIANRSAGRLFLGEYYFDPLTKSEVYAEGITFTSRPTSLNGYYKFEPCVSDISDSGIVVVELIGLVDGKETVICSAQQELPTAIGYTAFSVPLTYACFGVKASAIKVMFASSKHYGTIANESSNVVTYSDVVTSTSHGGWLCIDNLTLSY